MVFKIQTMRKLNYLTTNSLTGPFLKVVRFTLLELSFKPCHKN